MRTSSFLAQLRDQDIRVWMSGGELRCSAPTGVLTADVRRALAERKPEITALLRARSSPPSALVPIQAEGRGRPFFGVPGHNGDVFCFVRLARHLGRDRPFFALEPPGLSGPGEPLTRIEDLARHHLQALIAAQPRGPYLLGGYCLGGLIAFEMARQLHAQQRDVAELALFETTCPTAYRGYLARQIWVRTRIRDLGRRLAARRSAPPVETGRSAADETTRGERVGRATSGAALTYVPGVYPGVITFFAASQESLRLGLRRQGDWAGLSARGLLLMTGPEGCDPDAMLLEPHAGFFADRLRERLAAADTLAGALPAPAPDRGDP